MEGWTAGGNEERAAGVRVSFCAPCFFNLIMPGVWLQEQEGEEEDQEQERVQEEEQEEEEGEEEERRRRRRGVSYWSPVCLCLSFPGRVLLRFRCPPSFSISFSLFSL